MRGCESKLEYSNEYARLTDVLKEKKGVKQENNNLSKVWEGRAKSFT